MDTLVYGWPRLLSRLVRILVVDDYTELLETVADNLSRCHLYRVDTAGSIAEAESLIKSNVYHACVMDLEMQTPDHDELYLLRRYGRAIQFLVVSGKNCLETGCTVGALGARAFAKPLDFRSPSLPSEINAGFLRYLTTPIVSSAEDDYHVALCRDALVRSRPQTVAAWAHAAGIAERYLREKWSAWIGCMPKYTLFLYTAFSRMLACTCAEQFGGARAERLSPRLLKRWKRYYDRNSTVLAEALERRVQPRLPVTAACESVQVFDHQKSRQAVRMGCPLPGYQNTEAWSGAT